MTDYRVFISHKDEDKDAALAVRDELRQFSGDLEFFISGESIPEGEDWKAKLRRELKDSGLLLLLFTEPTRKWDWCLYEVGLFTSLDEEENEPVVCMYNPDGEPPAPLVTTQGVPATVPEVSQFIRRLITTTEITGRERPLNANVTEDQITKAADAICDHFLGNIQNYYACHRVQLELPMDAGERKGIPTESKIISASDTTMRVFGRVPGTVTWGELVQSHIEGDAAWIKEIDRVFQAACSGQVSPPTTQTFYADDGVRIFRPELYRLDTKGRTPVQAVIMLTQEVTPAKVGGPVFNRLRIAERYKTEVYDRIEAAAEPPTDGEIADLMESFDLIRDEARTLNVFEDETLRTSFPDLTMQDELRRIGEEWETNDKELRAAKDAGDNNRFRVALQQLDAVNDRYRAIVAKRYAELLTAA